MGVPKTLRRRAHQQKTKRGAAFCGPSTMVKKCLTPPQSDNLRKLPVSTISELFLPSPWIHGPQAIYARPLTQPHQERPPRRAHCYKGFFWVRKPGESLINTRGEGRGGRNGTVEMITFNRGATWKRFLEVGAQRPHSSNCRSGHIFQMRVSLGS